MDYLTRISAVSVNLQPTLLYQMIKDNSLLSQKKTILKRQFGAGRCQEMPGVEVLFVPRTLCMV
jgi:hypothetical protein